MYENSFKIMTDLLYYYYYLIIKFTHIILLNIHHLIQSFDLIISHIFIISYQ